MKNRKIFGVSIFAWFVIIPIVIAETILIVGTVIGQIEFPLNINFGLTKINEVKTKIIAVVDSQISTEIILTTNCIPNGIVSGIIRLPEGSNNTVVTWNTQGNTTISPNILTGNISIGITSLQQGNYNCSVAVIADPTTNITWISSFE